MTAMEDSMDELPFSLSCDRCDFRTKRMSAMRHHAQTHPSEQHVQHDIEEIGIGNHAPTDDHALQALVDSALNDASQLLLSSPHNQPHHHHQHHQLLHQDPSAVSSPGTVEEVGRTDSAGDECRDGTRVVHEVVHGAGHLDRKIDRVPTPRDSALAAEDLLGIYTAGIDFSVVGGNVNESGHFRGGCNEDVPPVTSQDLTGVPNCGGSGGIEVNQNGDDASSIVHSKESGGAKNGEAVQHFANCSKSPGNICADINRTLSTRNMQSVDEVNHNSQYSSNSFVSSRDLSSEGINPNGGVRSGTPIPGHDESQRNATGHPDTRTRLVVSEHSHITSIESHGIDQMGKDQCNISLTSQISKCSNFSNKSSSHAQNIQPDKQVPRPVFPFVIHRSAFSKSQLENDNPSLSQHKNNMKQTEVSGSTNALTTNASCTTTGSIGSRTRGQRTKHALEPGDITEDITVKESVTSERRRGRKAACPLKVIVSQKKPPSVQRVKRVGKNPRGRPRKEESKKMRYKCLECDFSCMTKKDLTTHTNAVHVKIPRKSRKVGEESFKINKSKTSRTQSSRSTRRTSRAKIKNSCYSNEEQIIARPRRLSRNRNKDDKSTLPVNGKRNCKRKTVRLEHESQESDCGNASEDDWVPNADDASSSEEEGVGELNTVDCPSNRENQEAKTHKDSLRTSQPSKKFKCEYCDYSCHVRKALTAHILSSHSDVKQVGTEKPKAKEREMDMSRVYRCSICNFSCHASHILNSHMKSVHHFEKMSGEFKCGVCGKVVVGRYSHFRRHLRCHSEERPYKCDQCSLAFRDANSLNCHLPIHKEARDYLCEDCGMAFKRPINLRMHRKVHSDKMFPCDECDYKCRRRNTLLNHKKRKHLKQKTVLCQHCGSRFFSKTECKNHVLKKHTQRPTPFACPICPAVFMFQYRFKAHLKTHPEIKPYKCHFCGFETRLNTYLTDHMRQHTGEKPKKCDQCDYQTSTNSNLYKHRKRHHGPGIPRLSARARKSRPTSKKEENGMVTNAEQKQRTGKSVVDEIVNTVEFDQISSQVNLAGSGHGAVAMFNFGSSQEFKQEQLMHVPSTDVHQGSTLHPEDVSIVAPVADGNHDNDRISISILDKTTSSVAAMMEALADARNMRPPTHHLQQPSHPTLMSNPYSLHLAPVTTPQATTHPSTTSSAPIFPRSVAAMAANMHYVHPNLGTLGGALTGGGNYHHLSALAGEAANRAPITSSQGQPTPHNVTISPPLIGVGQGQAAPQPLTHFPNIMHY